MTSCGGEHCRHALDSGGRIAHDIARGLTAAQRKMHNSHGLPRPSRMPSLLIFAIGVTMFHFANAAMLPSSGRSSRLPTATLVQH